MMWIEGYHHHFSQLCIRIVELLPEIANALMPLSLINNKVHGCKPQTTH